MDFISNRDQQILEMLSFLGVERVEELFEAVPDSLIQQRPEQEDGLSEYEGLQLIEKLGEKNRYSSFENYLGAGAYEHHVPAIVPAVCSKSEFLTAYTPYQAEASQGLLQAIFEFQSALCCLTGMDVANASVYDAASACAEAMLMCLRQGKNRNKLLIADSLHPHYRAVVEQYARHLDTQIITIPFTSEATLDNESLNRYLDNSVAGVLIQSPNFLGVMEDLSSSIGKIHDSGALVVLCANPLAYGLYKSAAEFGADIAVGDLQPLGLPLQFGGPYAGYLACKQSLVRQMPGRLVGETLDTEGRRGFVLTLQAREQHIRREKATSNICTNQALAALASLITMLWYGKEGIKKLALTNYQRSEYLRQQLGADSEIQPFSSTPHFNEFAVRFNQPMSVVLSTFRKAGIEPGLPLGSYFPGLEGHLLIAVTEVKSKKQLDHYIEVARSIPTKIQVKVHYEDQF